MHTAALESERRPSNLRGCLTLSKQKTQQLTLNLLHFPSERGESYAE